MEVLFVIAIIVAILVVMSVFDLFFKGIFILLPSSTQNAINSAFNTVDRFGKLLSLISFPFIGAYIGSWWSMIGIIAGFLFGIVCTIALRSKFNTDKTEEKLIVQEITTSALDTKPTLNDGTAEYKAGMELIWSREFLAAAEHFRAAIEINPHPEYYVMLGTCENCMGNTADALQIWKSGIDSAPQDPNSSGLYAIRAQVKLDNLGDNAGAVMDYTQAIALLPTKNAGYKSGYLGNRARAFTRLDDFDNASRDFTEAHQLDPENSCWIGERGALKMGHHDFHGAIADFSRALELDPNCDTADWKDGISFSIDQLKTT